MRLCKSLADSLLSMIAGKGNITWGLWFCAHSRPPSHGVNAVLVNLVPDKQKFTSVRASYYGQQGIIPYMVGIWCHSPLSNISSVLTNPFTLWESDKRWANIRVGTCAVCVCVCCNACVVRWKQEGSWGIQSLTQRSRDRRADTLQAQNNPGGIHEWNDRITEVLENLLRWLIMLFMVGRHAVRREKVKLFH